MPLLSQEIKFNLFHYLMGIFNKAKKSSLYSNAFYLMLNSMGTSILGFIFWNIMTRFFTPFQVGIGSSLVAVSSLLAVLANMGLGSGLIRFISQADNNENIFINTAYTLSVVNSFLIASIYILGVYTWSPSFYFIRENNIYWLLFIVFTIATSVSFLTDSVLIAKRESKYVFLKNLLICLLKFPLPIVIFKSLSGFGVFVSTGISIVFGIFITWSFWLPRIYTGYYPKPMLIKNFIKQILPYSFANYIGNLLNLAPQFIYPLMVLNILGAEYSAYFYIAWMMTMALSIIPNGISQSLFAEGSHNPIKIGVNCKKVLAISLMVTVPAVGLMLLFGGWLLHFFGSGYTENGTAVMRFLAIAIIPQCINSLYMTINQIRKQVKLIIAQTAFLAMIALGLGYWMLKHFGLPGLGMAYASAHLVLAVIVARPLFITIREKHHFKEIFKEKQRS